MKYILLDENNYVISVANKKLSDEFIEVENIEEPFQIYKYIDGKLVKDLEKEKDYNNFLKSSLKKKLSKKVSIYIKELLNYYDYDDIADLNICADMPQYKDEVKKIKDWIKEVYITYEVLLNDLNEIDIEIVEELLPKYKG